MRRFSKICNEDLGTQGRSLHYSSEIGGKRAADAAWSYERPFRRSRRSPAASPSYPGRVDAIEQRQANGFPSCFGGKATKVAASSTGFALDDGIGRKRIVGPAERRPFAFMITWSSAIPACSRTTGDCARCPGC